MAKKTKLAKRERPSRLITLRVVVDREQIAALRRVREEVIRNERDARAALGRLLVERLEELVAEEMHPVSFAERAERRSVDDLDLSVRAANILQQAGIKLVRDLAQLSEGEVRKLTNSSAKIAREIADELEKVGFGQPGTRVGGRSR
jgi:DNA-directed RNA polymerase alpha subunit